MIPLCACGGEPFAISPGTKAESVMLMDTEIVIQRDSPMVSLCEVCFALKYGMRIDPVSPI